MFGQEAFLCGFGWWWIFPIAMIVLCVFMMRGRMGCMTGWSTYRSATTTPAIAPSDSACTFPSPRVGASGLASLERGP